MPRFVRVSCTPSQLACTAVVHEGGVGVIAMHALVLLSTPRLAQSLNMATHPPTVLAVLAILRQHRFTLRVRRVVMATTQSVS
jgi:hypothetical protein